MSWNTEVLIGQIMDAVARGDAYVLGADQNDGDMTVVVTKPTTWTNAWSFDE